MNTTPHSLHPSTNGDAVLPVSIFGKPVSLWGVIVALSVALMVASAIFTPIFEGPDEALHFEYIRHLAVERRLPVLEADGAPSQFAQPPLYYIVNALAVGWADAPDFAALRSRPNPWYMTGLWEVPTDNRAIFIRGPEMRWPFSSTVLAVLMARFVSVVMGASTLVVSHRALGLAVWDTASPGTREAALAMIAFNPMFVFISSTINKDNLLALLSAGMVLYCLRGLNGATERAWVPLGILWGAALLTKPIALYWAPALAAFGLLIWRRTGDWRPALRGLLVTGVLALLISGWAFVRNIALYGDPTGVRRVLEVWVGSISPDWWGGILRFEWTWLSFCCRLGVGQIPISAFALNTVLGSVVAAAAGWAMGFVRRSSLPLRTNALWFAMAAVVALHAAVYSFSVFNGTGNQGRYLFSALVPIVLLWLGGLTLLVPAWARRWLSNGVVLGSFVFCTYAIFGPLRLTYAIPPRHAAEPVIDIDTRTDVVYGDSIRLMGYSVRERNGLATVSLLLQATRPVADNYPLNLRILSSDYAVLGERNTHTGLGRYPTSAWEVGIVVQDEVPVRVSDGLVPSETYLLAIAFVDPARGVLLPATDSSGQPLDTDIVGPFDLQGFSR